MSIPATGPRRILVIGAGVVGQVYAGRLAQAGCRVTLAARGSRLENLCRDGVRLLSGEEWVTPEVAVVGAAGPLPLVDVVLLAVRADQLESVLPLVDSLTAPVVVTMMHLVGDLDHVVRRIGTERAVIGFPGIGGGRVTGGVQYCQTSFLSTTLASSGGRENGVAEALRRAGFDVHVSPDMASWMATQSVFRAALAAAILHDGSPAALAGNPQHVKQVITGVRDGFRALESRGITPGPASLRAMMAQVPYLVSVPALRRELRGATGQVGLGPAAAALRDTELPLIIHEARRLTGGAARLEALFGPAGFPA